MTGRVLRQSVEAFARVLRRITLIVKSSVFRIALVVFAHFQLQAAARAVDFQENPRHLIHREWHSRDGLPHESLHSIAQDHEGYLWFGTENGLVRFDGVEFDIFTERSTPSIPHNFVSSLLVAKDGSIWCGTRTGGLFRHRNGIFDIPVPNLAGNEVWALAQTADHAIWVGTREGLARIQRDTITTYGSEEGLPSEHITALRASHSGGLWVGTRNGEIAHWDGSRFLTIENPLLEIRYSVRGFEENAKTGELWVGYETDGLFAYKNGEFRPVELLSGRHSTLQSLSQDADGNLWIGTQENGIFRVRDNSISQFSTKEGLTVSDVLSVMVDREGCVWIGTLYGGLNCLHPGSIRTLGIQDGLPGDYITCVVSENEDSLLVGTSAGLVRFAHQTFTPIPTGKGDRAVIRSLLRDRKGTLWIGTDAGLAMAPAGSSSSRFMTEQGLSEATITTLFEDRGGRVWIGTRDDGIALHDPATKTFTRFAHELVDERIRAFAEDSKGTLYIGTQDDLLTFRDGTFSSFSPRVFRNPISVRALLFEPDDTLWIGTRDDGLIRLDNGNTFNYSEASGLAHYRINHLLKHNGRLWMAGNRGIETVTMADLEAVATGTKARLGTTRLTENDGLRTTESSGDSSPGLALGARGTLWIATRKGLSRLSSEELAASGSPSALVKRVTLDHLTLHPNLFTNVPAGTARLQFDFAAIAMRNPERVEYQYRLQGLDEHWINAQSSRKAVYHNLRPGSFRFRVRASNGDGRWAESPAVLAFSVTPHFYQMGWVRGAGLLAGLGGIAGLIRWRTGRVRAQNDKLEKLVTERTLELRQLNAELEERVAERTRELREACDSLHVQLQERQNAENALARSEARLRRIVDSGMVGILFWNKDGRVTDANDPFLQMIGYTRQDLERGEIEWNRITPPEYAHLDVSALAEIAKAGVCNPFEKEYVRKDGTRVPIMIGGASFSQEGDRGVSFVLDMSERKSWEHRIRDLNQTLEARVRERTLELARINEQLGNEIAERKRVAIALSAFSHLGQRLHGARTETEAAAIVAQTARSLIPHDYCWIELYGPDERLYPVITSPAPDGGTEMLRFNISVPIRNGSRVVGILGLKSSAAEGFNTGDSNTLQALGDYCGGALDRIHAEEARREVERRFAAFMTNAPALAWMKDSQLRYVFTNQMFQRFRGLDAAAIEGRTDSELWSEPAATVLRANDVRVLESQAPLETQETVKSTEGEELTLLTLRFLFTTSAGEKFVAGMAIDITEQKRAEEALHRLPQSILDAQERERRRVARELHDGVNQAIASAKFRIQTAEQQILRGDPKWQETCNKTKEMLDSVLQQVRRISRNLRPGELDDLGLVPAARAACQEFEARTGVEIAFTHSGLDHRLPSALELTIYRIIQEALTNIEKHSGAKRAQIHINNDEAGVALEISDDGRGFAPGDIQNRRDGHGLGLLHMRERAGLVGGTFHYECPPGSGTKLRMHAPIAGSVVQVIEK